MKKLVFGLAAVMMCVSLAGCGGKAVDINELASALSSDGKFAEQLRRFHRILLKRDI